MILLITDLSPQEFLVKIPLQEGRPRGSAGKIAPVKQNPWEASDKLDLLEYETVIVSVGLRNFEEGRFSRKKHTRFKEGIGKFRISTGYLSNQEVMEDFRSSMKDNYPELCNNRDIIVIDCTKYDDPEQDKSLRSHTGRHHETMKAVVDSEKFAETNKPLRDLRQTTRDLGAPLRGVLLAEGLHAYSSRGEAYIKDIQTMIIANDLEQLTFEVASQ